jgi:hypothetical protein
MNTTGGMSSTRTPAITNGSGAAAILAAGVGAFALAVLAVAADKWVLLKPVLSFYRPTGPLSGVTTVAILVWIGTWAILEGRWRRKTVAMARVNAIAFTLLALSLLLTFPPLADLL